MKRRTFVKKSVGPRLRRSVGIPPAAREGRLTTMASCSSSFRRMEVGTRRVFAIRRRIRPAKRSSTTGPRTGEIRQAGDLFYADFANNAAFFEKYYDRMLVINGVDAQTNSHSAGIVHNWSGRVSEGYPSMTALLAAHHGPQLSLAYLSFGGFSDTASLTTFTRMNNSDLIRNIATPNLVWRDDSRRYLHLAD